MPLMEEQAAALADAVEAALPRWVTSSVERVLVAYRGATDADVMQAAAAAGQRAKAEVGATLRALLSQDIDEQRTTPLTLLRAAVRYPTEVLRDAGVPALVRDDQQERLFPGDVYDLAPANFADIGPSLAEPGLAWGAAKAFAHLQRHKTG
jgi:hypothetical protein